MAGFEIYDPQLRYLKLGHALWEPDPKNRPPVDIGDVGYIANGGFSRLFNIHLPEGHPSQSRRVPEGFEYVEVDDEHHWSRELPASSFRSRSVRVAELGAQVAVPAGGIMPISGQLSFRCSRQNGAVLVCEDVDGKDAHNILFYEHYLLKNIESWHAFARSQDLPLEVDDLMLVTGAQYPAKHPHEPSKASNYSRVASLLSRPDSRNGNKVQRSRSKKETTRVVHSDSEGT